MTGKPAPPRPSAPGMPCPDCQARIVATLQQILGGTVRCANCGLVLKVDTRQSRETLQELRRLDSRLAGLPKP